MIAKRTQDNRRQAQGGRDTPREELCSRGIEAIRMLLIGCRGRFVFESFAFNSRGIRQHQERHASADAQNAAEINNDLNKESDDNAARDRT